MPDDRRYWDACVFLSYINGVADRLPTIDALLADSEAGNFEIITSTVSVVEVAYALTEKNTRVLDPASEAAIDALWQDRTTIKLVEFYEELGREARALMRAGIAEGWSLKPKDAIHLATASVHKATMMHTYDGGLVKYGKLIGIDVCEPFTPKPRLIE